MNLNNLVRRNNAELKMKKEREINEAYGQMTVAERRFFQLIPNSYRYRFVKGFKGELSSRQAIKMMCLQCQLWKLSKVKDCLDTMCSLHPHRPKRKEKKEAKNV